MIDDPIVDEVRKVRNAHAKRFNYDIKAIAADLIKQQETSGHKLVSFPARLSTVVSVIGEPKTEYQAQKK
jgi:hypothetical protein